MAFVIPIAASFAAASAASVTIGAALTGAAGFATFATVAGGFMASAGMLTGNKTLTKIGSVMSLVGGVSSLASSMASGSSSAAGSAAGEAASSAVGEAAAGSATDALTNELANTAVGEAAGSFSADAAGQLGTQSLGSFSDAVAGGAAQGSGAALTLDPSGLGGGGNLMELAKAGGGSDYGLMQRGLESASVATDYAQDQALGKIAEAGAQFKDQSALQSMLDKLSSAGKWVKDGVKENKELALVGGQMLAGGMQSYQQGQQFDEQMNLLEARRRRLNQPVALGTQSAQPIRIGG